jgi:hypothetical protein
LSLSCASDRGRNAEQKKIPGTIEDMNASRAVQEGIIRLRTPHCGCAAVESAHPR